MARRGRGLFSPVDANLVAALGMPVWSYVGQDMGWFAAPALLQHAADHRQDAAASWQLQLVHVQAGIRLFEVRADGSVRMFGQRGPDEVLPAGTISNPIRRTAEAGRGKRGRAAEAAPNPFVPAVEPEPEPERIEPDPILGDSISMEGLSSLRLVRDVPPPTPVAAPPITADTVWLVGASGGVGVSTLARLAGGTVVDGGVHAPVPYAPAFVVAATHPAGLEAAVELARANARGETTYEIRGLVLVHDRPKLSRPIVQLAKQAAGVYPRAMTVPYMPAWREPGTPEIGNNVRVQRVIAALAPKRKKNS